MSSFVQSSLKSIEGFPEIMAPGFYHRYPHVADAEILG
jgi:hypothetical protein